jgi:quinohemoprotein amine dehydrogenase
MNLIRRFILILFVALFFWCVSAQTQSNDPQSARADEQQGGASEEGIPVKSALVIAKCSSCHKRDDKGRLTRISYQRRTPEGWELAIKRMVRLNGLSLSPNDARQIVKYLSKFHGLAPEESRPAFYEAERRVLDETAPSNSVRSACMQCHGLGRIQSQRRTREEWQLVANLHVGLFPAVSGQGFYRFAPAPSLPRPPDLEQRNPVDSAIDYFAKTYPLLTPEWRAWSAGIRTPRLEGRWLIVGSRPGHGRVFGEMIIEPTEVEDEFTTKLDLKYLSDGSGWTRRGRGVVYAGHSWRGRSNGGGNNGPESAREAMLVSRDWRTMQGRWFWGGYDELALDVQLSRVGREPIIAMLDRPGLKSGSKSERVTIYGANFPVDLKAGEIVFGPGITVERVVNIQSNSITVEISVAEGTPNGLHDITLGQHVAAGAIAIFDKVDYIKVSPQTGLARIGGIKYPKQYQQFEAIAYNRGPDGTEGTQDDVVVGPVNANWSIEEFPATYRDDDQGFVGTIDKQGLFTPAVEGPNPDRSRNRNNLGDVWVVASYKPETAGIDALPLKARSYLLVTAPLYVRWEMSEVSR